MNWYKTAQTTESPPKSYLDIGHRSEDDECEEYLWIWKNGRLEVTEPVGEQVHDQYWTNESLLETYTGRYDECQNRISIGIPPALQYNEVPNSLINQLSKKFSPYAEIWASSLNNPAQRIAENQTNSLTTGSQKAQ